ncbi:MAG: hypothetical protein ACM3SR_17800 [Ignavibacteriales bacterium]
MGFSIVRELIKLITDYPIRIEKEFRRVEVDTMGSRMETHSKKTLGALTR